MRTEGTYAFIVVRPTRTAARQMNIVVFTDFKVTVKKEIKKLHESNVTPARQSCYVRLIAHVRCTVAPRVS